MLRASVLSVVAGLLVTLGNGCSRPDAPRGSNVTLVVPLAATHYSTEAGPKNTADDENEQQLRRDVAEKLAQRGEHADSDAALDAAAAWALAERLEGRMVDAFQLGWAFHHFGFMGRLVAFSTFKRASRGAWQRWLDHDSNLPITRYGIRVSPDGQLAAAVFGSLELDCQPIPRVLALGQSVVLTGRVASRFSSSHVYLARPDGGVEQKALPDRTVASTFLFAKPGEYRLEVMGDDARDSSVVVNVPLYVGIPEPLPARIDGTPLSPQESKTRLFTLLNQARQAAGQPPLEGDAELEELALSHSADMTQGNFFGHVSPTMGTLAQRYRRGKVSMTTFGELLFTDNNPEAVHRSLLESPVDRAMLLRPELTHVGIGVAPKGERIVVSIELGRRAPPLRLAPDQRERLP